MSTELSKIYLIIALRANYILYIVLRTRAQRQSGAIKARANICARLFYKNSAIYPCGFTLPVLYLSCYTIPYFLNVIQGGISYLCFLMSEGLCSNNRRYLCRARLRLEARFFTPEKCPVKKFFGGVL